MIIMGFISLLVYPAFAEDNDSVGEHISKDNGIKNVININAGAAVVLGLTFKRFHIPINYERVIKSDVSIVIGNHPAFPVGSSPSGTAYGASVRIRKYSSHNAPGGFWREWGIWGLYQKKKSQEENRSKLQSLFKYSMAGVLFDGGYKFFVWSHFIIEPFIGISLPVLVFKKNYVQYFGTPFPWAGLSLGFAF
jgi:hypothetical protein